MSPHLRLPLVLLLAVCGSAVVPAAGAAAPTAPYSIAVDTPPSPGGCAADEKCLVLRPAPASSRLAVTATAGFNGVASTVEFRPPADGAVPADCITDTEKTSCLQSLANTRLRFDAGPLGTLAATVVGVLTTRIQMDGGGGEDVITISGTLNQSVTLNPGAGNDQVTLLGSVGPISAPTPDAGDDRYRALSPGSTGTIDLGPGDDLVSAGESPGLTFNGGTGQDTITGRGVINGGDDDDLLQPQLSGQTVTGGSGTDRLSYSQFAGARTLTVEPGGTISGDGTKTGLEELEGSPFNDTITGSTGADRIVGGSGADTIDGRGGGDTLDGGPGSNTVSYASAPASVGIDLPAQAATIQGGTTDSIVNFRNATGSPSADTIIGTNDSEALAGNGGNDTIDGGLGNDALDGGEGDDALRGNRGTDSVAGGNGTDTVLYDERGSGEPVTVNLASPIGNGAAGETDTITGVENVLGGAGSDTLTGDAGPNAIDGGPGLNAIDGGAGNDILVGGANRDSIIGGPGTDVIRAGDDDDSVNAEDKEPDNVDCGPSSDDDAQTDPSDAVTGCEYSRRSDVPIPVDADADGFVGGTGPGSDCNDANRAINPQAVDVPGNRVDEDCDGFDQPIPYVDIGLSQQYSTAPKKGRNRGKRTVVRLTVNNLVQTAAVRVTCTAPKRLRRACPFRSARKRPARRATQVNLKPLFKNRKLPAGVKVELRVTAPSFNGRVVRIDFQEGAVRQRNFCVTAPSTRPKRCPEGEELG